MGKPIVWTMHDKWCATGLCHHSGSCTRYIDGECGHCQLLHSQSGERDYSHTVWRRKQQLYSKADITFVAVSNWLKEQCTASRLMALERIEVIGNPVALLPYSHTPRPADGKVRMLMVAARVDDPIKGLDILCEALHRIKELSATIYANMELTLLGELKNSSLLADIDIPVHTPGSVSADQTEGYYREADLLLSPSRFETLPGTLVEAQMWGALPVAFESGGQRDIVEDGITGILAPRSGEQSSDADAYARAILRGVELLRSSDAAALSAQMYRSVQQRFEQSEIANRYIHLFNELIS